MPPGVPAVVLAAGLGKRIAARTRGGPKALLDLLGRPLLSRTLDALEQAGFENAIVVTGHGAEQITAHLRAEPRTLRITERWNPDFAVANNIVSMLSAADLLADGFCLLNSDIVFDASVVEDIAQLSTGNWMVVDGDEPLGVEEMKVALDERSFVTRVHKGLDPTASVGEYIGITRFDADGARAVLASAASLVAAGGGGLYYEDAIDAAANELQVRVLWMRGRAWTEIDDEVDYQRAVAVARVLDGSAA